MMKKRKKKLRRGKQVKDRGYKLGNKFVSLNLFRPYIVGFLCIPSPKLIFYERKVHYP